MEFIKTIEERYIKVSSITEIGIDTTVNEYIIYVKCGDQEKSTVDKYGSYLSAERMMEALLNRIGATVVYG